MGVINIKAYTADTMQIDAIKAFMKALKIKFEVSKETEKPYNEEFVKKIKQGDKEFAEGKGIKMSVSEFKALCK
ncbi:MAG: hypothetical protein K2Q03_07635 [Sphingobacteriaceae bacterium]|nr:hypothetical protein [Sphingobacteriaceae bacterium]